MNSLIKLIPSWTIATGLLALGACEGPRRMAPTVPALAPPSASSSPSPGSRLLEGPAAAASEAGAGALGVLLEEFAAEGDRPGAFVEPGSGECMLLHARGSEGIDDLDLLVFSEDGSPVAVDEAPDPAPALLLCPPHGGRVFAMVRVMTGRGRVALGAQPVPLGAALRVGKALRARSGPAEGGWPGLDEKAQAVRRRVGGRWRELRRALLPAEARAPGYVTEAIGPGRCLLWMAVPSEETSELDAALLDGEGRAVGRATELGRVRLSVVCSATPTSATLELRPRIGAGVIAVVIASSEPGSEADIEARVERLDLAPTGAPEVTLGPLQAALKGAGYEAPAQRIQGVASSGKRASIPLQLAPGCARIDVGGGAPLSGLGVSLWTEGGALLGQGEGGALASFFGCSAGGPARLEVEALLRPGPFLVELRPEAAPPELRGLAGGRLLSRMNTPGVIVRPSELTGVQRLPLRPTSTARAPLTLAAGQCLTQGAALEEGTGLELRVLESSTQEELARGGGTFATTAHLCARDRPLTLWVEARMIAGEGTVLLASHRVVAR